MSKPFETRVDKFAFKKILPILRWLPKYTKDDVIADFIAGLTVGLTMMPQSIAYANLAGLPAQYGLYTAFIGSFAYVFFGTIKEVSIGPSSLMALLSFSYTEKLNIDYVILLSFLAGSVELLMGVFKLGFLVSFISPCVTSAFTTAMALTVAIAQLKNLLGLRKLQNHGMVDVISQVWNRLSDIRFNDTILGVSCIIFLLIFKHLGRISRFKRFFWLLSISRNALVVLLSSVIAYYNREAFILSGDVPSGLPMISLPSFSTVHGNKTVGFFEMVHGLGTSIVVIPVAAVLANVAIAQIFVSGVTVDATQEMITLGLCNIFGSFIQAMPSCGAFSRSAVASSSDVRTPLQGIYSGMVILLALSFLTPYFYFIPRTALAAVLMTAVTTMYDFQIYPKLWKSNKFDFYLTIATLLVSIFYGVELGIIVGGFANLIILLKVWSRPEIIREIRIDEQGEEFIYIKPEIGIYYSGTEYLNTQILEVYNCTNHLAVTLDCSNIIRIDYAGCQMVENLVDTLQKQHKKCLLINLKPEIYEVLRNSIDFNVLKLCHGPVDGDANGNVECQIPLMERKMSGFE